MKHPFPIRTAVLFTIVCLLVLVSFLLWAEPIDEWIKETIGRTAANKRMVAFLLFAVLSSDIFLPIPSCLVSMMCGLYLGFGAGTFVSFAAMSVSAAVGYLIGLYASDWARKLIGEGDMQALQAIQAKGGAFVLLGLRSVPILAEVSLVFAGLGRYPLRKTIAQVAVGNGLISGFYAWIGAYSREAFDSPAPAFLMTIAASALFLFIGRLRVRNASR